MVQQVVQAIIKNERAHAIEDICDAADDEISVHGEEEGAIHAASWQSAERSRLVPGEEVPHVKVVDDAAGLAN